MGKHRKPKFPRRAKPRKQNNPDNETTQELNRMTTPLLPFLVTVLVGVGLFYAGAKDVFK